MLCCAVVSLSILSVRTRSRSVHTRTHVRIMYLEPMDLPGGTDFVDVTAIFAGAAQRTPFTSLLYLDQRNIAELDASEMIFADGYSLNDAMSALEVRRSTSIHTF